MSWNCKRASRKILKIDQLQPIIVIGAGNLGSALIGYPGLREHKFHIAAAFDSDPAKIGRAQGDLTIHDEARMREINAEIGCADCDYLRPGLGGAKRGR